jgi:hypothetical protein
MKEYYRVTCSECGDSWRGWLDGFYRLRHRHAQNGVRWISEGWWLGD